MLKSYYVLKLNRKEDLSKLFFKDISFFKIKYKKDDVLLYVNKENFNKIEKYFKIYDIDIYKVGGLLKYRLLLKKYNIFTIMVLLSLIMIYILSHITFDIKIMSNNKEIVNIILKELNDFGIKKYHFVKSFKDKELIKKKILHDYKDKIEWLEIDLVGSVYKINVLERVISKDNKDSIKQNVVSSKNAIIREIRATNGEVVKKVYDYVNKGDIIISGEIKKGEDVKGIVKADGKVFGETWYNVRVELPLSYDNEQITKNCYNSLTLNVFDKRIFLFKKKKYNSYNIIDNNILSSTILPLSLNKSMICEVKKNRDFYTYDMALNEGLRLSKEYLLKKLDKNSEILLQKKLKLYEENNIIVVEVFMKVYEDITSYEEIKEGDIDADNNWSN